MSLRQDSKREVTMKLTAEERRRVHLAQQAMRTRMLEAPAPPPPTPRRRLRRALAATALLALASGLALAGRVVEFHPPTSLVDAFLPRS